MDLKELEAGINPHENWYYQSKLIPLVEYVKSLFSKKGKVNIVDFGAGSGFFSKALLDNHEELIDHVYQIDIGYEKEELGKGKIAPKISRYHFIPEGIDNAIVVMMDVLEHLENDSEMLMDIKQRMGGAFHYFITVPAFMSVWSAHDVYLEHYRRYTISTLSKTLREQHYHIDRSYYLYGSIFPAVWILRRFKNIIKTDKVPESSDMKPLPSSVNAILKAYNSFEMRFRKSNKLFGLTCTAEGQIKT